MPCTVPVRDYRIQDVFTPAFQVAYLSGMLVAFSIVAWLTRARARRIIGALCSVAVFTALSAPIDTFGIRNGLWGYPSCTDPPYPPLPVYVGQALAFVGCLALIAWRVQRRFGLRAAAKLGLFVCVVGAMRDFTIAALMPQVIRVGPLPASLLADMAAWAVVVVVALGVTRIVAGPADADALR
jgi:hypothetical protein